MKPAIFKDANIQNRFDKDGYVLFDFIGANDAQAIADKFYEIHRDIPPGFYADAYSPDDAVKKEIFEHTEKIVQPTFDKHFKDYKKLGSTFLCKAPGKEGLVGVHQDWTSVDESKYYSATIWIPTVDTTEENGALRVIPGSHLFFNAYRSNNIPVSYRGSEQLLWDSMITVNMKAGQALVINHAILHASSPNFTDKERLIIAYGITCKYAKLMFYHREPEATDNTVEKFDMPDDFFLKYYNVGKRPLIGKVVERIDYLVKAIPTEEIKKMVNRELIKRGLLKAPPLGTRLFKKIRFLLK